MGHQPSGTLVPAPSRAHLPNVGPGAFPRAGDERISPPDRNLDPHLQARLGDGGDGGKVTPSCPGNWSGVGDSNTGLSGLATPWLQPGGARPSGDAPLSSPGPRGLWGEPGPGRLGGHSPRAPAGQQQQQQQRGQEAEDHGPGHGRGSVQAEAAERGRLARGPRGQGDPVPGATPPPSHAPPTRRGRGPRALPGPQGGWDCSRAQLQGAGSQPLARERGLGRTSCGKCGCRGGEMRAGREGGRREG